MGAALGLLLAVGTVSSTSVAETPGVTKSPDDESAEAARIYIAGVRAAKMGQWRVAYEAYRSAWRLKQHFQIAANLGRAELKIGKHRDAAEHLAFFLREAQGVSGSERAVAQKMLGEAKAKIATLEIIVVRRERAVVLVDGVPVGTAPLGHDVYVEPGVRRIEARLQGVAPTRVSVVLAAGESRKVTLRSEKPAVAVIPRPTSTLMRPLPSPCEDPGGPRSAVLVAGGVTSALALGAGIVLRAMPHQKDVAGNASTWSFAGAGVVGVTTLAYAVLAPRRPVRPSGVRAIPVIRVAGPGISLIAQW